MSEAPQPPVPPNGNSDPAPQPVCILQFIQHPNGRIEIVSPIKDGTAVVELIIKTLPDILESAKQQQRQQTKIYKPAPGILNRLVRPHR